ncbi:Alpha-L-AF-C domain-containing protein [Mycena indigotica]|uniref:non-reducing end alpha-L-arabinofuranosidase n=1 Tax=Mycena indigotica TaxID=2126181 RepID=A0A8H6S4I7_9AGAR|nr:Alpha-L-AF-C domain-containing protein [Mycena indigotica]KAF7291896.1 Alpha-L-AF-C domain-containing protein [Mycena indigotica]
MSLHLFLWVILFALRWTNVSGATTVSVSATASHPIPTTLWGQMFEDISHVRESVRIFFKGLNPPRAGMEDCTPNCSKIALFNKLPQHCNKDTTAALNAWLPIGESSINVVADPSPLSSALPNSLVLVIPPNVKRDVGFANTGYWGINFVKDTQYTASLNYRVPAFLSPLNSPPTLTISLLAEDGSTLAAHSTELALVDGWTEVDIVLTPDRTPPSLANRFAVTVSNATHTSPAGIEVHFALLSLFPPTFKGRKNGMRTDIAQALADAKPAFFRFPGGNNLEGQTTATRWQWRNTVGPLSQRPGRVGDWSYINTDGLGLLEYLHWCEDLDMEPFMAVWDGYSLGGSSVTGDALGPFIAEAIEQINFVIGDPNTSEAAALRASLGHAEPFKLRFVEIGNEDFVGQAPGTVASRWNWFATNLSATFPQLHFMATSRSSGPALTPTPEIYDAHNGLRQTHSYTTLCRLRNGIKFFEGEYASTSTNSSNLYGTPEQGRLLWPTVAASVGEAAFMMGFERNADIVFSSSYAPLLGHVNNSQWTPNLVGFDAGKVYKSTSYHVQKVRTAPSPPLLTATPQLFANNRGDEYLPSTLPNNSTSATLIWSVTRWTATNQLIIKISNSAAASQDLTFVLPFESVSSVGSLELLTGAATTSNTPAAPDLIAPVASRIPVGTIFNYTAPATSFSIITLTAQ